MPEDKFWWSSIRSFTVLIHKRRYFRLRLLTFVLEIEVHHVVITSIRQTLRFVKRVLCISVNISVNRLLWHRLGLTNWICKTIISFSYELWLRLAWVLRWVWLSQIVTDRLWSLRRITTLRLATGYLVLAVRILVWRIKSNWWSLILSWSTRLLFLGHSHGHASFLTIHTLSAVINDTP